MQLHSRFEAMMSDVTAGILILAKVETATVFPWYLSTPPPSTNATLETWKLDIKRGAVTSTFCISWGTQGETHMEVEKWKFLASIFLSLSHFSSFFHFHVFSLGKLLDNGFLVWTELQLGSSQTYGPRQRHSATQNTARKHTEKWRFSKGPVDLLLYYCNWGRHVWLFVHSCSLKTYKYHRLVEGLYLWASCGFTATCTTEVSEGFQGFAALFPVYLDIPYSHTVEGIAAVTFFQIFCGWKLCHFVSQSCFEFANIEHSPQPITALGMAILGLLVAVLGRLFYGHSDVKEVLEWKLPGWHKMISMPSFVWQWKVLIASK